MLIREARQCIFFKFDSKHDHDCKINYTIERLIYEHSTIVVMENLINVPIEIFSQYFSKTET